MTKTNDAWPEKGEWINVENPSGINGSHQHTSDYGIVNTPSVWVAPENVWTEDDRHQLAVQLLSDFIQRNAPYLSREQFNQLFRIKCLLDTDTAITDEDRQWADNELRKLFGEKDGR